MSQKEGWKGVDGKNSQLNILLQEFSFSTGLV